MRIITDRGYQSEVGAVSRTEKERMDSQRTCLCDDV